MGPSRIASRDSPRWPRGIAGGGWRAAMKAGHRLSSSCVFLLRRDYRGRRDDGPPRFAARPSGLGFPAGARGPRCVTGRETLFRCIGRIGGHRRNATNQSIFGVLNGAPASHPGTNAVPPAFWLGPVGTGPSRAACVGHAVRPLAARRRVPGRWSSMPSPFWLVSPISWSHPLGLGPSRRCSAWPIQRPAARGPAGFVAFRGRAAVLAAPGAPAGKLHWAPVAAAARPTPMCCCAVGRGHRLVRLPCAGGEREPSPAVWPHAGLFPGTAPLGLSA